MPERNLQFEVTLRDAEIIRLKDIIIILENIIQNDENLLNKARKIVGLLKKENADYRDTNLEYGESYDMQIEEISRLKKQNDEVKNTAKELEESEKLIEMLLDELQKIDP